ncbi:TPA: type IV pilus biogenesis protein PilP [Burkholderia cenocepacia]|uniref:type IV pilus biogenesis protein PilP n=1 Tax=Burkholderia TaxID=32008 RepID=UPI0019655519|nr:MULTISPECIES: type IV pilus biogenesis protein PilP [Burkholderia]MCQ4564173.1 type IV pilus biogenesis protein PilP [Burkholderia contaminans]MCW3504549.1 type IV pilus biogenesis protein PilP [Burkholderia cenocepacia]MCW3512011.1 type IV pilus biogenesis protein PilP [Burkholderia cenocepacia]MCW3519656.1 type IV pilus biogenesis protein PilP [Burkholderia cenocepacia]MCW3535014.1 type IV pilus biogenesis protein PilP [Burkholderia cenocepacia]
MKSVRDFAVPLLAVVATLSAHAAPTPAAAPSSAAAASAPTDALSTGPIKSAQSQDRFESDGARLASMQKRIAILEGEKRIAELEKAIRDANGTPGAGGLSPGLPAGVTGPLNVGHLPVIQSSDSGSGFVEVKGIDSYNGKFSATLSAAGRVDDVHVGDTFAGWRVARITVADVTLTRNRAGRTETRVVRY